MLRRFFGTFQMAYTVVHYEDENHKVPASKRASMRICNILTGFLGKEEKAESQE